MIKKGDKFYYLTAIEKKSGRSKLTWKFKCDCGKEIYMSINELPSEGKRGRKSCGCKKYRHNGLNKDHKKLYDVWFAMNRRCYNPKAKEFKYYGGKNVKVYKPWKEEFSVFLEWALQNGYQVGLTLDRINSNGNYEPSNCRWTDYTTQIINRKRLKNNTSGKTGVSYDRGYWVASITRHKKTTPLGHYKKIEDAIYARERAERYYEKHGTMEGYK